MRWLLCALAAVWVMPAAQAEPCREYTNAAGKRETRCNWEDFDADAPFADVAGQKRGNPRTFARCVRYLEKLHAGQKAGRAPKCRNLMKCEMAARKPGPFDAAGCLGSSTWDGRGRARSGPEAAEEDAAPAPRALGRRGGLRRGRRAAARALPRWRQGRLPPAGGAAAEPTDDRGARAM